MMRPPALTAVSKARRRSSLLRPIPPKSPRAAVRRTVTSLARVAAPLPVSMSSGRHTINGTVGASTKNTSQLNCSRSCTPRATRQPLAPIQNRTSTPMSSRVQRQGAVPVFKNSGPPSRTTGRAPSAPAVRPPSEVAQLKEKLVQMQMRIEELEQTVVDQKSQFSVMQDMNGMLKESLQNVNLKLERTSTESAMNKDLFTTAKQQLEITKEMLDLKESLVKSITTQLEEKDSTLRKLHNDVVDLRGQIRVVIRVRPMLKTEETCSGAIEYAPGNSISIIHGSKTSPQHEFEKVFPPCVSQEEVFQNVEDFILSALHGYNIGLIAFGQTGSGKTYTMRGAAGPDEGVIPRAAGFLFRESKKLETMGWTFEFSLSCLEIYNNEAYDLLNKHSLVKVRIVNGVVSLDGLSEHKLVELADLGNLLRQADTHRKTAATKCNENSSRSHAVYMWKIKARQESTGISTTSVLKLVDLAGSERAKESGATGEQFTEMTAINKSLSVLQKCVSMQKTGAKHVPYRDVKLTQVLMDCLGAGQSKTMVIVNINPCDVQAQESKRSIEFAARMRDTHIGSAVQQRDF